MRSARVKAGFLTRFDPWVVAGMAVSALTAAAVVFDPFPALRGPAPYPPEWQWLLRDPPAAGPFTPALATVGMMLLLMTASGTEWARRHARFTAGLVVTGAVVLGLAFELALLRLEPAGAFPSLLGQTVYRTATSYYTVAVSEEARDPLDLVRRYDQLLPGLVKSAKHASTHPPGPVLFFRGLLAAYDSSPAATRAVLGAMGLEETNPIRPRSQHALASRAAAVSGGLLIALFGAATAWPIAVLARHAGCDRLAAARLAVLWSVVPGPALMTPMLDQALALPVAGATACLAAAAVADQDGRARGWALAAGALGGLALWLSYGAPVFLAFGGLAALALAPDGRRSARHLVGLAFTASAVAAGFFFLPAVIGHRPVACVRAALAIHREVFTAPRSYALWLLFNPVDLAVFLGMPVAVSWVWLTMRSARARPMAAVDRMRLATAFGLALIVLAGVTRGEVGRLWIPLMPTLLVAALVRLGGPSRGEALAIGSGLAGLCLAIATYWRVP
jgi:hypothetical protein